MAKRKTDKIAEARIQRAVNGLLIPMMQSVPLYALLSAKIIEGADDTTLAQIAHDFIYGKEAA